MAPRYECRSCGWSAPYGGPLGRCPRCGGPLDLVPLVPSPSGGGRGVWRYPGSLPPVGRPVTLGEGGTPLLRAERIGERIGLDRLLIKDETRNPTGSFVDRGSTVLVSAAREAGYGSLRTSAKGNVAASLAAYAAAAGMGISADVSGWSDYGKLYQLILFGADLTGEGAGGGAYEVRADDPLMSLGYSTAYLEVLEDLGRAPDWVVVPVGTGTLLWSLYRAAEAAGDVPRFLGVQARPCDPVARAFREGRDSPGPAGCGGATVAWDLAEPDPPRGAQALLAARESGGAVISVGEGEAIRWMAGLAEAEGILVEAASAVAVAGLAEAAADGTVGRGEEVVLVATGTGLKDPRAVSRVVAGLPRGGRAGRRGTKLRLLGMLAAGPRHPYGLWKSLRTEGIGLTKPAVYRHLRELEELGLVRSRVEGGRRLYSLTWRGELLLSDLGVQ